MPNRARATRRTVVSAARDLFVEVGGKVALLKLALDWALVGDDEPGPMSERPVIAEMERRTDPHALMARWAQFVAELDERAAPLAAVLVVAADVDPVAAERAVAASLVRLCRCAGRPHRCR